MRNPVLFCCLAVILNSCMPRPGENIDLSKANASFKLADGSALSQGAFDEYNPTLIKCSDGYLVLVFGSSRSCGGCTAGNHNLFVSVSTSTYNGGLALPAFSAPVAVRPDGSALTNSASRLQFASEASGLNALLIYKNASTMYTFQLDPTGQANGIGLNHAASANPTRTADALLGFGPKSGTMLSRDGSNVVRYSSLAAAHNGRAVTNATLATAENATRVNSSYTRFNSAVFSVNAGSLRMGTIHQDFGIHPQFQDAISRQNLQLKTVQIFNAGSTGDLLLFSAEDGSSEDLYVVTSHTVAQLWDLVGAYGNFTDSDALRNQWTTLAATLPQTRIGMAAGIVGSKGYFIAGFDGVGTASTIYEFDFTSETFTNCGNGPATACTPTWSPGPYGAAAVVSGSRIYVLGGTTTGSTYNATNTFGYFDTAGYTVTSGLLAYPVNRMSPSVVISGNQIFAMGGSSNAADCAGTYYNCTNNYFYTLGGSWSAAQTPVPYGFTNESAVASSGSIFIFGGSSNGSTGLTAISEYNISGNSWPNGGSPCANLAQARFDMQTVVHGSKVYIMGGMHSNTSYNNVDEFDLTTKSLTNCDGGCAVMPATVAQGSALLYGNSIYYFGGRTALLTYVNTVYKYTP